MELAWHVTSLAVDKPSMSHGKYCREEERVRERRGGETLYIHVYR